MNTIDCRCGDCFFFVKDKVNMNEGRCHAAPPTVVAIPVQTPVGSSLKTHSIYPPIPPNYVGCGRFINKESESALVLSGTPTNKDPKRTMFDTLPDKEE